MTKIEIPNVGETIITHYRHRLNSAAVRYARELEAHIDGRENTVIPALRQLEQAAREFVEAERIHGRR